MRDKRVLSGKGKQLRQWVHKYITIDMVVKMNSKSSVKNEAVDMVHREQRKRCGWEKVKRGVYVPGPWRRGLGGGPSSGLTDSTMEGETVQVVVLLLISAYHP